MFLQEKDSDILIKILDLDALINPNSSEVTGKDQHGQEEQDSKTFSKTQLVFPSGESLPRCWLDANYREG